MSRQPSFRGQRMKEAMDKLGLSSGQVAYRMNVSGAAVRGWTTGRRGIDPDDLVEFARIVAYPVEYFLYAEYGPPDDLVLVQEVRRLSEQVLELLGKVDKEPGYRITSDEQAIDYLRDTHGLGTETVAAIRRILGIPQE